MDEVIVNLTTNCWRKILNSIVSEVFFYFVSLQKFRQREYFMVSQRFHLWHNAVPAGVAQLLDMLGLQGKTSDCNAFTNCSLQWSSSLLPPHYMTNEDRIYKVYIRLISKPQQTNPQAQHNKCASEVLQCLQHSPPSGASLWSMKYVLGFTHPLKFVYNIPLCSSPLCVL